MRLGIKLLMGIDVLPHESSNDCGLSNPMSADDCDLEWVALAHSIWGFDKKIDFYSKFEWAQGKFVFAKPIWFC